MTDLLERAKAALEGATPNWQIYSEPDVGLPPSLFAGNIGTDWFGPIEPLEGHDLNLAVLAPELTRALIDTTAERDALRAQLAAAVAQNKRLHEALTPSGATKAAYIGEVKTDCADGRMRTVSWTATKEIMAMIRARGSEPPAKVPWHDGFAGAGE